MKVGLNDMVSLAYGGKVDVIYFFPCLSSRVDSQVVCRVLRLPHKCLGIKLLAKMGNLAAIGYSVKFQFLCLREY